MRAATRPCPLCGQQETIPLANLEFGDFDGVGLDRRGIMAACRSCGLVYNDEAHDSAAFEQYYRDETLYAADLGVGSGGTGPCDQLRYGSTLKAIQPFLSSRDAAIVDVGCAKGGFLSFLKDKGFTSLLGVDINPACVEFVQTSFGIPAETGTVLNLPLGDSRADVLVYSHVLEHIHDLFPALAEARRTLKDDGLLLVELPDAARYSDFPVAEYHWLGLREHINHFDAVLLRRLLEAAGFPILDGGETLISISPKVDHPVVYAVCRKNGRPAGHRIMGFHEGLLEAVRLYLNEEQHRLASRRQQVAELAASGRPAYIWGIGLEFFTLYIQAGLRDCNIRSLIDKNPVKRERTVDGLLIRPPECLRDASPEQTVVITSALHKEAMVTNLKEIGFQGEILVLA